MSLDLSYVLNILLQYNGLSEKPYKRINPLVLLEDIDIYIESNRYF